LNTPDALSTVFELVSLFNHVLQQETVDAELLQMLRQAFRDRNAVLGIISIADTDEELLDEDVERLIEERNEVRKAKNWGRADEIRDLLQARGILLEDTPQGLRWRRK